MPYPADYGGVFDLFYKIKALYECGAKIHLHCFEYGRGQQEELENYCESVNYYERKRFLKSFSFRVPFIVSSRENQLLLNNLLKDNYPVLLEGIHCTYFLYNGELKNREVFVRLHNVEYEYYAALSKSANNVFRNLYFKHESNLLKKYEQEIAGKAMFIAVSEKDKRTYQQDFQASDIKYLPAFLPFKCINSEIGSGDFCLYHGNLSVSENEKAVLWLLENVFNGIDIPFVIAGKNPPKHLEAIVHRNENVCLVANPSAKEMDDLIRKAHVHVLPSFNKTGVKIKLLNALFNGRFIITNVAAIEESGLEVLCNVAGTPPEFKKRIGELFNTPFTEANIIERKKLLTVYDNHQNALKLMQWIW